MVLRWFVRPNAYYDSVRLMRVSESLAQFPGISHAAVVMATPLNLDLLADDGLLPPGMEATPDDLVVTVQSGDEAAAQEALDAVDGLLAPRIASPDGDAEKTPARTLDQVAGANLAIIGVPGQFAAAEAYSALYKGMHVFLFSDNVALEDEVRLKALAAERDLLMMGPDCGTAIIDGVGLGFANRVQRGPVGIVGASGTGIQQLCCLLDEANIGIAQAIGTGGRDLWPEVGASMTRRSLWMLESDPTVEIIAVISKPADRDVAQRLHRDLSALHKPAVVCLLGETLESTGMVQYAADLTETAGLLAQLLGRDLPLTEATPASNARTGGRVYGLFAGGTLKSEAARILATLHVPHELIDLGEDDYTRGRAHPMIDPRLRVTMLEDLAEREDVGVILLDVILGDLAHPDPAGALLPAVARLHQSRPHGPIVASLIGTRADPQGLEYQREILTGAGVQAWSSNATSARVAGLMVEG